MQFRFKGVIIEQGFNKEGELIEYSYQLQAYGLPLQTGAVTVQAFDMDTGEPLIHRGYPVTSRTSELSSGEIYKVDMAPLGLQPDKNLHIEFRIIDDAGIIQDRQPQHSFLLRPPEPDEVVPEETTFDEEQDAYIEPTEDGFIAVIPVRVPVSTPELVIGAELLVPALPWYVAWLEPIANFFGLIAERVANHFNPIVGLSNLLGGIIENPLPAIKQSLVPAFETAAEEGVHMALEAVDTATGESPEWKTELAEKITGFTDGLIEQARSDVSPEALGESPLSPDAAASALTVAGVAGLGLNTAAFIAGVAAEAATLGQLDGLMRISRDILGNLGLNELSRAMVMYPLEPLVLQPARYHWNAQFTPMIPTDEYLIRMVVREVITVPEFQASMKYHGFDDMWTKRIWDAHFIAPSLGQLLVPFRRGQITAAELTALQILVDLDPRYNAIWEQQWYNDPTPRQGRFMLETGAIDETRLRDIVVRSGLTPDFVDPFTEYMVRFQERPWRRMYLVALASGYRAGVYDSSRVESEVTAAGYSVDVAKWIIATEDVKREIAAAKVPPEKFSLISVSYATDAFINGDVDESWLREYFEEKGYRDEDVEVAVGVLNRKRDRALAA